MKAGATISTPRSQPSLVSRFVRHRAGLGGAIIVAAFFVLSLLAPIIAPHDPLAIDVSKARELPSPDHWLGTDQLGRDILSRLLHGASISQRVGVLAVVVGISIGVPLGAVSGYLGGAADLLAQRLIDTLQAFPGILLALLVGAIAGPNLAWTVAVLGILSVPAYARLIRGSVLLVKELMYVDAARCIGCGPTRLITRHILPNALSPVIVQSSLQFAFSVLLLAALGFLGLGAQPPTPEWGAMVAGGRAHLRTSPHIVLFPGLVISALVLALNLVGDALRDALDPRAVYGKKA